MAQTQTASATHRTTKAIPEGYHSLTPYLTVKNIGESIDFYRRALGAEERMRLPAPDGHIMHGEIKIGDSLVMLGEENQERGCVAPLGLKGHTSGLYLYVPDVDAAFERAEKAGAKVTMPLTDMFWGDRVTELEDPSGHRWSLATRKEDLTEQQVSERARAWAASARKG